MLSLLEIDISRFAEVETKTKGGHNMRKPDIIYTDILPRDINLYIDLPDEECHEIESAVGSWAEQRFDILIWLKEEN